MVQIGFIFDIIPTYNWALLIDLITLDAEEIIFIFYVHLFMIFDNIHENILKRTVCDCNIYNIKLFFSLLKHLKDLWHFECWQDFKNQISIVLF